MKLIVINVGETKYSDFSIPFIEKLCKKNDLEFIIIDKDVKENYYNLHPAWIKLLLHELYEDDFIISWDLDLVPCKMYDLKSYFDTSKLNLAYDGTFIYDNHSFINGKFKYNTGLIGIPKIYSKAFKNIYDISGKDPTYPSYEQYYINDWIYDNKVPVNRLVDELNVMKRSDMDFPDNTLNKHYTHSTLLKNDEKLKAIKVHYIKHGDILRD